jgi:protein-arginine kinase activator protein McsA
MEQEKETNHAPTTGKNTATDTTESSAPNAVIEALKKEYFKKIRREKYPDTPEITEQLDQLEQAIKHWKELP